MMHDLAGAAAGALQAGPLLQQQLKCPRCHSINTKFCYYNNYNLSQPRHFCRDCRRYWTRGGTLRNIPVGGGTRKSSKHGASSSSSSSTSPSKRPNTLSSSATPAAAAPATPTATASPSAPPMRLPTIEHVSVLRPTRAGVLSLPGETDLARLIGSNNLGVGGGSFDNMAAPAPLRTRVQETVMRLQEDLNCRNGGGGGWPDLSIYTPSSKFQ